MSVIEESNPGIRAAADAAAPYAAQTDAEGRIPDEVMEALVRAGFARWFVPQRWGGGPGTFVELADAVVDIARQCASAGWLASLLGHSGRYVACLPEQGQAEVWDDGPDTRVVSVVKPQGTAVPVEGGWRLTGSWTYASGVEFSDWALLAGPAPGPGTDMPGRFFVVPRAEYTYLTTWDSLGMRGTASHTVVLDDVFVPEYRTCLRDEAMNGKGPVPLSNPVPTLAVNGLTFVAPALGAALGALNAALEGVAVPATGPRAASGQAYQIAYARAAGRIDSVRLLLDRVAATADHGPLTPDAVMRSRRDSALALEILVEAVDELLRTGGTRAQEAGHPLQRFWRDVRSVGGHAVMQFEPAGLAYTQGLIDRRGQS